ncbi:hypothetical protein C8R43DRAFT_1109203 [Mycena crocata]|nr:hypothetical protein C8R43DRAFT_1109203 [Mycena crocata]
MYFKLNNFAAVLIILNRSIFRGQRDSIIQIELESESRSVMRGARRATTNIAWERRLVEVEVELRKIMLNAARCVIGGISKYSMRKLPWKELQWILGPSLSEREKGSSLKDSMFEAYICYPWRDAASWSSSEFAASSSRAQDVSVDRRTAGGRAKERVNRERADEHQIDASVEQMNALGSMLHIDALARRVKRGEYSTPRTGNDKIIEGLPTGRSRVRVTTYCESHWCTFIPDRVSAYSVHSESRRRTFSQKSEPSRFETRAARDIRAGFGCTEVDLIVEQGCRNMILEQLWSGCGVGNIRRPRWMIIEDYRADKYVHAVAAGARDYRLSISARSEAEEFRVRAHEMRADSENSRAQNQPEPEPEPEPTANLNVRLPYIPPAQGGRVKHNVGKMGKRNPKAATRLKKMKPAASGRQFGSAIVRAVRRVGASRLAGRRSFTPPGPPDVNRAAPGCGRKCGEMGKKPLKTASGCRILIRTCWPGGPAGPLRFFRNLKENSAGAPESMSGKKSQEDCISG